MSGNVEKVNARPELRSVFRHKLRSGDQVLTSGQLPLREGTLVHTGKVGSDLTLEQGQECAQQCVLNAIAAVRSQVPLEQVRRVVKLTVFVASDPAFTDQPKVANGASDLVGDVFGEAGQHTRSAVGVAVLPLDAPVEVELVVEV